MTKKVGDFLEDVAVDLGDPNYDFWSKGDLLSYLVDGLGAALPHIPDQFTSQQDVTLADGAQQSMPVNAVNLVGPVCNLVAGVPGRFIRSVNLYALDRASPSWRSGTPSSTIKGIAYEPSSPTVFFTNPPAVAGTVVRLALSVLPTDLALGDDVPVDDTYLHAMKNYLFFRAYARDDDHAAQNARAMTHFEAFQLGIGATSGQSQ